MADIRRMIMAEQRRFRRRFVTPEGVDLGLDLGAASARAGAFLLDLLILVGLLVAITLTMGLTGFVAGSELLQILWMVGSFVLRNGWFTLFEMGSRGATPGKRAVGLRVVARDGRRLTGGAVIARNAMREIEVFLPLSFLLQQLFTGQGSWGMSLAILGWTGVFVFFPLFNRDRLRVGDLIAGTWVVRSLRQRLAADLVAPASEVPRRRFSEAALSLYGEYELQTLEDVIRMGPREAWASVAATIRHKADIPPDSDDFGFLMDYYQALCARLERGMMLGSRREDKFAAPGRRDQQRTLR